MKRSLSCGLFALTMISASGQLANTKWKTTLNADGPRNVLFDFRKDTVSAFFIADSSLLERMTFTDNDNTLALKKVEGQSDCDGTTIGKYHYEIQKEKLFLKLVSDDCNDRSSVLDTSTWFRWKDPKEVYVNPAILAKYVGTYQYADKQVFITLENNKLMIEGPAINLPKRPLIPESDTRFFLAVTGFELDFVLDSNGTATSLISHEQVDYQLKKIK